MLMCLCVWAYVFIDNAMNTYRAWGGGTTVFMNVSVCVHGGGAVAVRLQTLVGRSQTENRDHYFLYYRIKHDVAPFSYINLICRSINCSSEEEYFPSVSQLCEIIGLLVTKLPSF